VSARAIIGAAVKILGTGLVEIESPSTVDFDFGDPNDLHLPSQPGFSSACRILIVLGGIVDANPGGEDPEFEFAILDAPDDNGVIGTPAPAIVDNGVAVGEYGHRSIIYGLLMQVDRPWLRITATKSN
jgi:hypothetical protein